MFGSHDRDCAAPRGSAPHPRRTANRFAERAAATFSRPFLKEDFPMKRALTLSLALLLCTGAVLLADDTMKKDDTMKSGGAMQPAKMMTAKGTITKMDKDGKSMTVKNAKGKEMTMYWDDSTKVTGDMKEGSMATVHYMMSGGKMMAHQVMMQSDMKSEMKK
jgi:hypothetical protein